MIAEGGGNAISAGYDDGDPGYFMFDQMNISPENIEGSGPRFICFKPSHSWKAFSLRGSCKERFLDIQ